MEPRRIRLEEMQLKRTRPVGGNVNRNLATRINWNVSIAGHADLYTWPQWGTVGQMKYLQRNGDFTQPRHTLEGLRIACRPKGTCDGIARVIIPRKQESDVGRGRNRRHGRWRRCPRLRRVRLLVRDKRRCPRVFSRVPLAGL